jgi:threonylcarbamoyladenosine tRNA methylthiotransferase MtaB
VLKNTVTVAFQTLGCKLNQAETEFLSRELVEAGCTLVLPDDPADIYVINTCSVTSAADAKSRHFVRQMHHLNPGAHIVAIGCYAESRRSVLEKLSGVDLVLDNTQKPNLLQMLKDKGYLNTGNIQAIPSARQRTRSFIKAQEGCSNFCTYCIVPSVRGAEKSLSAEFVVDQINQRVREGFKEIVLTGTEIGRYLNSNCDLKGLVKKILNETEVPRLRVSSLQPQEISEDFLKLWQDSRLCCHFHLSLQSGSDTVLSRMNRRYTSNLYRHSVELIRSTIPEVAVTTDVIVGFPGETQSEFEVSRDYCRAIGFARLHIFPFSRRAGTVASSMHDQVMPSLIQERAHIMLSLARSSSRDFDSCHLGRTFSVLFEQKTGDYWTGLTPNYIKVFVESDQDLTNRILNVRSVRLCRSGLTAEIDSN